MQGQKLMKSEVLDFFFLQVSVINQMGDNALLTNVIIGDFIQNYVRKIENFTKNLGFNGLIHLKFKGL